MLEDIYTCVCAYVYMCMCVFVWTCEWIFMWHACDIHVSMCIPSMLVHTYCCFFYPHSPTNRQQGKYVCVHNYILCACKQKHSAVSPPLWYILQRDIIVQVCTPCTHQAPPINRHPLYIGIPVHIKYCSVAYLIICLINLLWVCCRLMLFIDLLFCNYT